MANTYLLVIRDNDNSSVMDVGDLIEAKAELPDGSAPWFGRVPLMSSSADGHDYGGRHSIIKVIGLSLDDSRQYVVHQLGFAKPKHPDFSPNLKYRSWKLDHNKLPLQNRARMEGAKQKSFISKFDVRDGNKNNWRNKAGANIEDDVMTLAEFEAWTTLKPRT